MTWTKEQRHEYNIKWRQDHPDYDKQRIRDWRNYNRNYRTKHPDKVKAKQQRIKLEVLQHYSQGPVKCAICGEMNLSKLTLDHIHNDGNEHRKTVKSGTQVYYWARRNHFPPIFQILCFGCNMKKARSFHA